MSKIIVLKIDDPDDFLYHNILSLLSSQETIIETVTEGTIISVTPDFTVYPAQRRVFSKVSEIILTRKEYDILLYFLQNTNRVLSFTQIYEYIWKEPDYGIGQGIVGHHVQSLRRKLNIDKDAKYSIRSVRGIGYYLEVQKKL